MPKDFIADDASVAPKLERDPTRLLCPCCGARVSLRGMNGALRTSREEAGAYPVREATYYGNVFAKGQPLFACLSPGQTGDQRVCGDSLDDCPMDVVGSCASACVFEGQNGQFDFCSTSGKAFRPETYRESVTVFLPKPGR